MKKAEILTVLFILAILIVVFIYYFHIQDKNAKQNYAASSAAEVLRNDQDYTDIDGNPVYLSEYQGSIVIASAWASWCPQCLDQLRLLGYIAAQREDVVVLAFNRAEPASTAKNFLKYYELDTEIELIIDSDDYFYNSISGYSMPETVIYDLNGTIFHHERGQISVDEINFLLDSM